MISPYNNFALGKYFLINLNTSCTSSFVGISPVPIDHIGSYATII